VGEWVRLCSVAEAPGEEQVMEAEAKGVPICLARVEGRFVALDNVCPHRQGPLGGGSIEGGAVVCPWHAWAFDLKTGMAVAPAKGCVAVYPVRVEAEEVLVELPEELPVKDDMPV